VKVDDAVGKWISLEKKEPPSPPPPSSSPGNKLEINESFDVKVLAVGKSFG